MPRHRHRYRRAKIDRVNSVNPKGWDRSFLELSENWLFWRDLNFRDSNHFSRSIIIRFHFVVFREDSFFFSFFRLISGNTGEEISFERLKRERFDGLTPGMNEFDVPLFRRTRIKRWRGSLIELLRRNLSSLPISFLSLLLQLRKPINKGPS